MNYLFLLMRNLLIREESEVEILCNMLGLEQSINQSSELRD